MQTLRKYWPFILVAAVAITIPVWALLVEPAAGTAVSASDEQFEKGILKRSDNRGDVWALQKASGPSLLSFRKPGSPIALKTEVRRVNSGMVLIGLVLQGRAGETYRPTIKQNGSALSAPGLQIIDKQGKVIEEGEFAYG